MFNKDWKKCWKRTIQSTSSRLIRTRTKQSSDSISTLFTDHLHMIITKNLFFIYFRHIIKSSLLIPFYLFPAHQRAKSIYFILHVFSFPNITYPILFISFYFYSRTSPIRVFIQFNFFPAHHRAKSIHFILIYSPHTI